MYDDEGLQRVTSPIPWVMAGVTVMVLLVSYALDQWGSARVERKVGSRTVTLALHFGRDGITPAGESGGRAVTTASAFRPYEGMPDAEPVQETRDLAGLIVSLLFATCLLRLAMAALVHFQGHARPAILAAWASGTLACLALVVVVFQFNDGGLMTSKYLNETLVQFGSDPTSGLGLSAWRAIGALLIDAFSILAVKAAMTPRAPRRRPRRRYKSIGNGSVGNGFVGYGSAGNGSVGRAATG